MYPYVACPRDGCYYAKLDKVNKCTRCNTVANLPACGITAMLTINDDDLTFTAKIFQNNTMSFYHATANDRVATGQEKVREIQGQGKVREF